jgi:SAM-dependent methyltransferase
MKASLLAYLQCPSCGGALRCEPHATEGAEIVAGTLRCAGCGTDAPILRGVPRFVPSRLAPDVKRTVEGFGYEWTTFFDDITTSYMASEELLSDFIRPVTLDFFRDKVVLDAGCGMGRFTRIAAAAGARDVIAVDLSDAVDAAYRHTRGMPNAHVVQADLFRLPLRPCIDYAFSLGVVCRTAAPPEAFRSLVRVLHPDGAVSVWVCARENNGWVIYLVNPVRRITCRLPRRALLGLSHVLGAALFVVLKTLYAREHPLRRALPYREYLTFTSRLGFRELTSVIFDHLVPQISHYIRGEEFERWFREAGLADVVISLRNGNSWRGFGRAATACQPASLPVR